VRTIVCHGGSLTEGSDLEKNYTWPHLVENKISEYCLYCRSALTPAHEKMVELMIGKV
jgi:hypothetical protein